MTLQKNKLLNWFLVFALSLTALDCFSHSRSESYSKINVLSNDNFYQVNLSANISNTILNNFLRLNVFNSADDVRNYASSSFKLGDNCEQDNNFKFTSNQSAGYTKIQSSFTCQSLPDLISINLFLDLGPSHAHISKIYIDNVLKDEHIFNSANEAWQPDFTSPNQIIQNSFSSFFKLGFEHILEGLDHLAFLLGLVLLFRGKELLLVITGFTIGHSITLALGTLNFITVNISIVEMLIGFSIFIVGLDQLQQHHKHLVSSKTFNISLFCLAGLLIIFNFNLLFLFGLILFIYTYFLLQLSSGKRLLMQLITIFFGLIHGLAFASNLSENPIVQDQMFSMILGFNLGIEVGQILIALLAVSLLTFLKSFLSATRFQILNRSLSMYLIGIGLFWFVSRSF